MSQIERKVEEGDAANIYREAWDKKYVAVTGDLFVSQDSLCHCVSRDFAMGRGIALDFKRRFGRVDELLKQAPSVGQVAYLRDGDRYIFYLVTKQRYWQKPVYEDLRKCLEDLRFKCSKLQVKCLSMPRIGCGLDRLEWSKVQELIQAILCQDALTVTVYSQK